MDKLTSKTAIKNISGFSVIEIMIAMAIIITTLTASILVSFGNQNFLIGEKTNSEAIDKARELLERARAEARKDFKIVSPIPIATDGIYKKWLDVSPSSNAGDYFAKIITSNVLWTDNSGMERSIKLSSLITDFENANGGDTCDSFLTGDWTNPQTIEKDFADLVGDASGIYPIADIDAYQGKLYVAINTPKLDSGPNDPASAVDSSAIGTLAWSNSALIKIEDGSNATVQTAGTIETHYLKASNFGFNIPKGATILGIKVDIFRNASGNTASNAVIDKQVRLLKADGSIGSANKASGTRWSTVAQTDAQYGGAADLWGETYWNPENINSPNFGIVLSVAGNSASANRTANVDNIQITVAYIKEFYVFDISNPVGPILIGGLGNNDTIATGFNAVATDGKYAYVAANSGVKQFQIIDVSSETPFVASSFEIPDETAVGKSIFYRNGYVYLGLEKTVGGKEFNIIDVHNPLIPKLIGGFAIGSGVSGIYVRGNYAFITHPVSDINTEQLTVLDISDPANPSKISGFFSPGGIGGHGKSLSVVGDTLYLGRTATNISGLADTIPEFYALDASDLNSSPPILGSLPLSYAGDSVNKILIRDYLAFLLTNKHLEIRKVSAGNPWNFPPYANFISFPNSGSGVALDCEGNYLYSASVPASGGHLNKGAISITTSI